jgi:hypothetical protein
MVRVSAESIRSVWPRALVRGCSADEVLPHRRPTLHFVPARIDQLTDTAVHGVDGVATRAAEDLHVVRITSGRVLVVPVETGPSGYRRGTPDGGRCGGDTHGTDPRDL